MATKKTAKKKPAAKKPASKTPAKKTPAKKAAVKTPASKKTPAKKAPAKKTPAKKAPAKKASAKKAPTKKASSSSKKAPAKKAAKKAPAKKASSSSKKSPAKQVVANDQPSSSATATVVQHVFLGAPPASIFSMLTEPEAHGRFTGTSCSGTAVEGERWTAGDGYMHGEYEEVVADAKIVQTWSTTEWPKAHAPSRLEIVLEPADGGTELVMTHSGLPPAQAEQIRQGWIDFYWTPLRAALGKEV